MYMEVIMETNISKYVIVKKCCTTDEFTKEIQSWLDKAYRPYGNLIVMSGGVGSDTFIQAMVM